MITRNTEALETLEIYTLDSQITSGNHESEDKILIVKRLNLTFSDEDCQLITFSDVTAYRNLEKE